ncbi:hypothetical protein [Nocardia sp. IFM 10818]
MNTSIPPLSTRDPRPSCGHEECTTWCSPGLGYVTDCLWASVPVEPATTRHPSPLAA